MNAVILAAGVGERFSPLSRYYPKHMLPFGDGRIIDHVIGSLSSIAKDIYVFERFNRPFTFDYLKKRQTRFHARFSQNDTSNLLNTLAQFENKNKSDFLWIGASMIFESDTDISRLVHEHIESGYDASLFIQKEFPYTPKISYENGCITKFTLNGDSDCSSPTCFMVKDEFLSYCMKYNESDVFQEFIESGKQMNLVEPRGWNIEIHDVLGYLMLHKRFFPFGFVDSTSTAIQSSLYKSYVYGSKLLGSSVTNSIIIDSTLEDECVVDSVVINNLKINIC